MVVRFTHFVSKFDSKDTKDEVDDDYGDEGEGKAKGYDVVEGFEGFLHHFVVVTQHCSEGISSSNPVGTNCRKKSNNIQEKSPNEIRLHF